MLLVQILRLIGFLHELDEIPWCCKGVIYQSCSIVNIESAPDCQDGSADLRYLPSALFSECSRVCTRAMGMGPKNRRHAF